MKFKAQDKQNQLIENMMKAVAGGWRIGHTEIPDMYSEDDFTAC